MSPPSSSPPTSSQQSSLYQFYTPIPSSSTESPSSQSRILQPSTRQNISSQAHPRATVKRPLQCKEAPPIVLKKPKPAKPVVSTPLPQILPTVRRHERETFPRGLLNRTLQGKRGGLSQLTCLSDAKTYYSRPIDMHHVQCEQGAGTFPFAVQCCNTNSLTAVSDENGDVRLLDTSISQATGITTEYIRMNCHDNAIFDISWSADDMKLATASGDQTGKVFDIMSRRCIAVFSGYHKTTLKKVEFKPDHTSLLTTSSRDGSIYIWDLRCTGIGKGNAGGPRYKPISSILGGHPISRGRRTGEMVQGCAITGLTWSGDNIISACDANSYIRLLNETNERVIKVWDPRKLNALATKAPVAVESSAPPKSHRHREYGITSIATQQNRVYALSKDSHIYALSLNHLSHGPTHDFSHARLRCDSFWIKLAVQNDLLASGSSDAVVVLTSSNPDHWQKGGVVLRGGHSREVSDVAFIKGDTDVNGEGVCSVGDDMVVRVWREGSGKRDGNEDERGCGFGWAE